MICELVFRMMTFEYDPTKGRFRGWLKTLTHNLMAKLKREQWPQVDDDDESPLDLLEAGEDLAARLAAEFDLELLEKAKDQVRDSRPAAHVGGVRGNRRRGAKAGRGRS